MRQQLLWILPAVERHGISIKVAPPVPVEFSERDIKQVWTLYLHRDQFAPPALPFRPVHHHNAFAEDFVHDWNVRKGHFRYASRAIDGGVWLLLEFK